MHNYKGIQWNLNPGLCDIQNSYHLWGWLFKKVILNNSVSLDLSWISSYVKLSLICNSIPTCLLALTFVTVFMIPDLTKIKVRLAKYPTYDRFSVNTGWINGNMLIDSIIGFRGALDTGPFVFLPIFLLLKKDVRGAASVFFGN